jgi:hypothetical protein
MTYQIKRIRISAPPPRGSRTRRWIWWITQRAQAVRAVFARTELGKLLLRVAHDLTEDVVPSPQLLRDEEVQIEIRQAWYRQVVPFGILRYWWIMLLFSLALTVALGYLASRFGGSPALGLFGLLLPLAAFGWATEEKLRYKQWLLLVTNRRTIVYMPAPRSRLLVDNVRLQAGRIQVVDVNFSPSRWWRLFQLMTGARDLVISISGYEFKPDAAEVKGGLVIPDIMPEDVSKLEEIVFPLKK